MGWFDDDDEDEEDSGRPSNASAFQIRNGDGNGDDGGGDNDGEEEEEDPLDAYMKSLDATSTTSEKKSSNGGGAGGRLDHDAEDEATFHWEIPSFYNSRSRNAKDLVDVGGSRLLSTGADFDDLDNNNNDDDQDAGTDGGSAMERFKYQAREARSAMSSTFVRAGGGGGGNAAGKKAHAHDDGNDYGGGNDDDDEPLNSMQQLQQQRHQMLHQEVDPLERVDHRQMKYPPFRRQFYAPPNTESGHAWRREHDVVCTPGNFDPILGFGELVESPCINQGNDKIDGNYNTGVFPPELLRTIAQSGYDSPTLVQSQTLPVALSGNDALITASTGSGKTLAYLWPMVVHILDQPSINPGVDGPIGIILTPTRELAKQVHRYAQTFVECVGGYAVEVSGGTRGTWELIKELKKGDDVGFG